MTILLTIAIVLILAGLFNRDDEGRGDVFLVLGISIMIFWMGGKFAHMGKEEPVPATITLEETGPVRL